MKKIRVIKSCERPWITVPEGEPVKVIRGRKSVIVTFIESGDTHCFECCFRPDGSGLSKLGLGSCMDMQISCAGGCFKTVDHILEYL